MFGRIIILFSLGGLVTFVLNMLHMEYKSNLFPNNVFLFLQNSWWNIPLCGFAAVYIGIMYPYIDHILGECHHFDREWATIIRCVAVFFGLNHLCAKLTFSSIYHFFLILMIFCLLFWYWFDKTKPGLIFNITHALIVILSTYIFRYIGIFELSEINYTHFDYLQTCLLWLVFSGCITFGNIGRLMNLHNEHNHNNNNNDNNNIINQTTHQHSD